MKLPPSQSAHQLSQGSESPSNSAVDTWDIADAPAPPRPQNRIVRTGTTICLVGFAIAIVGVWQLAEQKNHATPLAHFTHKMGLLTMLTGFVAMLLGYRDTSARSRSRKPIPRPLLPDTPSYAPEPDWRDKPWRTM